ncbi:AEC family transporter [Nicoliella spurrieriana]|uniref:AEC family transporter n=1 Tax=Nicoliella spurrieriana TaxID=2925830 RepID=A0A976X5K9_9LACO|nr:AEC family transporter [Nicoliella spurrieriana]UQS87030.1 AEC family transporter [Nicoliella spurrieriana]
MAVFIDSISGIVVILLMILLGFFLAKRGWFDDKTAKLIAKLVTQVALPAYMISTITGKFTASKLLHTLPDLRFPVVSMLILFGASVAVARALGVAKFHRGLFESMFFNSNTVFVGLPVNLALFGARSLPYVLVYYMANTTFFWTLGVYLIQRDGDADSKFNLKQTLQKVFSPPLLGFIVAVILVLLNIPNIEWLKPVLKPVFKSCEYVGGLTTPLSMIFIGIAVSKINIKKVKFNRLNWGILLGRFIMAPLLMTLLVAFTGMPVLMKQVFILQSAMPVMTNAPVVSKLYDADDEYASLMVTETTLMSLLVIPILMTLVQKF